MVERVTVQELGEAAVALELVHHQLLLHGAIERQRRQHGGVLGEPDPLHPPPELLLVHRRVLHPLHRQRRAARHDDLVRAPEPAPAQQLRGGLEQVLEPQLLGRRRRGVGRDRGRARPAQHHQRGRRRAARLGDRAVLARRRQ